MKRSLKWCLFVMIILVCFALLYIQAFAANGEADFSYAVENGEATVTGCFAEGDVTVPDVLGGVPVTAIGDNAFAGLSVTSVSLPETVLKIGAYAFADCTSLTSFSIPDNTKTADITAFSGCTQLETMYLGKSLNPRAISAFPECLFLNLTGIKAFTASAENKYLYTVDGVVYLNGLLQYPSAKEDTQFTIPANLTWIYERAMDGCDALTAIYVEGNNFKSTDNLQPSSSFYSVDGVLFSKSGVIWKYPPSKPDKSYSTGNYGQLVSAGAFRGAKYLETLTLSRNTNYIGDYAFYKAENLKKITFLTYNAYMSAENIGAYAFAGTALTEVYLLNWHTLGEGAFSQCSSLKSVTLNANTITDTTDRDFGEIVLSMPDKLFEGCSALREIRLGNKITSVSDTALPMLTDNSLLRVYAEKGTAVQAICTEKGYTFRNSGKGSVTYSFDNGVLTLLGDGVTDDYTASSPAPWSIYKEDTTEIIIAGEIIQVGKYAFNGFASVTSLTIGDDVLKLCDYCCKGLTSLRTIQWSSRLQVLMGDCFNSCSSLTVVDLPETVKSLGSSCFYNCYSLTDVDLTSEAKALGQSAFNGCRSLTSIFIPDNIQTISTNAFQGCTMLQTFTVGKGLQKGVLGSKKASPFGYAPAVKEIIVSPDNPYLTSVDGVLYSRDLSALIQYPCKKDSSTYSFPNETSEIYSEAFLHCAVLTTVRIETGSKLIALAKNALSECTGLREIYIPSSVATIDATALPTLSDNSLLTVYSYKGTAAEELAVAKGYTFVDMHPLTVNALFADGILTLSGSGDTTDFDDSYSAPWLRYAEQTTAVIISDGITRLGAQSFDGFSQVSLIILGENVAEIADNAFTGCGQLKTVIAFSAVNIAGESFAGSSAIRYIEDAEKVHTGALAQDSIVHTFAAADGAISLTGNFSCGIYEFFDIAAAFAARYTNIQTFSFESLHAEDFIFYSRSTDGTLQRVDGNSLTDAQISVAIDTPQGSQQISFNDLCLSVTNGGIDEFYLVVKAQDDIIEDTDIQIEENIIQRVLRWVVTLFNRFFSLFTKMMTNK